MKPLIGISSCLLGNQVRYDGRLKLEPSLKEIFGNKVQWLAVCPEVEMGLSTPREKIILLYELEKPSLQTLESQQDLTKQMQAWCNQKIQELKQLPIKAFIFKSKSPSCGIQNVDFYPSRSENAIKIGTGLFAKAFLQAFPLLPVIQECDLQDYDKVRDFLQKIKTL